MALEAPRSRDAVLELIEAQQRKIQEWAGREIAQLDRAAVALGGSKGKFSLPAPPGAAPPPASQRRRRRRGSSAARTSTTPAAALERRQAILRFLVEHEGPAAPREIRQVLKLTESSTQSALRKLNEDGKVTRTGAGASTLYESKNGATPSPAAPADGRGSLEGRILETIRDRGSASFEELAQATRAPREEVQRACGVLVLEEEIRMERRERRSFYVLFKREEI